MDITRALKLSKDIKNLDEAKELCNWVGDYTNDALIKFIESQQQEIERLKGEVERTTTVIRQFLNSPTSHATKGILEACCKFNESSLTKCNTCSGRVSEEGMYCSVYCKFNAVDDRRKVDMDNFIEVVRG